MEETGRKQAAGSLTSPGVEDLGNQSSSCLLLTPCEQNQRTDFVSSASCTWGQEEAGLHLAGWEGPLLPSWAAALQPGGQVFL